MLRTTIRTTIRIALLALLAASADAQTRGADDTPTRTASTEADAKQSAGAEEEGGWWATCVEYLEPCAELLSPAVGVVSTIAEICDSCFGDGDTETGDDRPETNDAPAEACSPEGSISNLVFTHFGMANPGVRFPHFNAVGLATALTGIASLMGAADHVSNSDLLGAVPEQLAETIAAYNNRDFARFGAMLQVTVKWDVCTDGAWTPAGPATFTLAPPASHRSAFAGRFGIPANTWSPASVMGLTDGDLSGADAATMAAIVSAAEGAIQAQQAGN